ncbi:MAG: hypothetical protein RR557_07585 [Bacilli bacterium]
MEIGQMNWLAKEYFMKKYAKSESTVVDSRVIKKRSMKFVGPVVEKVEKISQLSIRKAMRKRISTSNNLIRQIYAS